MAILTGAKEVDPNMPESRKLKIKLKATGGHPYIAAGEVFEVHPSQQKQLQERGWAVGEKDDHKKVKEGSWAVPATHAAGKASTDVPEPITAPEAKDGGKK